MPRGGEYELFTYAGRTSCYDDGNITIDTPAGMFEWIRAQDTAEWRGLKLSPDTNIAFYLTPKLYLLWKLRWYTG